MNPFSAVYESRRLNTFSVPSALGAVPTQAMPQARSRSACQLWAARVDEVVEEGARLADGCIAQVATSCFIAPERDDLVCCLGTDDGEDDVYVIHVLQRAGGRSAVLAVPGIERLRLSAREIAIEATSKLSLTSLVDCELNAVTGMLELNAQNLVQRATGMLTQLADHLLSQAETVSLRAEHLLSAFAQRHLVIAEKEVRIDGDVIQMG